MVGKYEEIESRNFGLSDHAFERKKSRGKIVVIVVVIIAIIVIALGVGLGLGLRRKSSDTAPFSWTDQMNIVNLMGHLADLENIASRYNNSRAVAYGYNASMQYVVDTILEHTSWQPRVQFFNVSIFTTIEPSKLALVAPFLTNYTNDIDFGNMGGSNGYYNVTAAVFKVTDLGCNETNYAGFVAGQIALVKRGVCTFIEKIELASTMGASAILVYNDGTSPDRMGPFPGVVREFIPIPGFSLSFTLGSTLVSLPDVTISLTSHDAELHYTTSNVLVDTPFGSDNDIIVVGAHLDSVPAGPGINDDGSGTSNNLQLAIQLYKSGFQTTNKIRFGWWGAEEIGLLGSTYYVDNLNSTDQVELRKIAMNLNFDMIGSPNYFVGLHDGSLAPKSCVNGSIKIRDAFETNLNSSGIPYELIAFDGRSDYGPFIAVGIPAGGLFTGAEGVKSPQERSVFGGYANAAYDPCYHQACDTVQNINQEIYIKMSKSAASVLQVFAMIENLNQYLN